MKCHKVINTVNLKSSRSRMIEVVPSTACRTVQYVLAPAALLVV